MRILAEMTNFGEKDYPGNIGQEYAFVLRELKKLTHRFRTPVIIFFTGEVNRISLNSVKYVSSFPDLEDVYKVLISSQCYQT